MQEGAGCERLRFRMLCLVLEVASFSGLLLARPRQFLIPRLRGFLILLQQDDLVGLLLLLLAHLMALLFCWTLLWARKGVARRPLQFLVSAAANSYRQLRLAVAQVFLVDLAGLTVVVEIELLLVGGSWGAYALKFGDLSPHGRRHRLLRCCLLRRLLHPSLARVLLSRVLSRGLLRLIL